jgi:hypothetical protein
MTLALSPSHQMFISGIETYRTIGNAPNPRTLHSQCSQPYAYKQELHIDMSNSHYWEDLELIPSSESGWYEIMASKPSTEALRTTYVSLFLLSCTTAAGRRALQRYSDLV